VAICFGDGRQVYYYCTLYLSGAGSLAHWVAEVQKTAKVGRGGLATAVPPQYRCPPLKLPAPQPGPSEPFVRLNGVNGRSRPTPRLRSYLVREIYRCKFHRTKTSNSVDAALVFALTCNFFHSLESSTHYTVVASSPRLISRLIRTSPLSRCPSNL
jgi:hypothetical protein